MPRRRQRFNKLFDQLKAAGNSPEAGSRTANFLQFLTGNRKVTQANKIPVDGRKLYEIALLPFALSADSNTVDNRFKATISAYSVQGLESRANATEAQLGIYRIVGGEQENDNYYPALIRAKYDASGSTVQENKPSGITGETYRYKYGRTFSFPFGRTATATDAKDGTAEVTVDDADELDVLRSVQDQLKAGTGTKAPKTLSYEAEVFKDESKGTPLETGTTLPSVDVG